MRLALIADTFPPMRNSGAVQLRDLSREFMRQGHKLTVMLPAPGLSEPWQLEDFDGVEILRLRAPQTKDVGHVRRTLAELAMPFAMLSSLRKSPLAAQQWDGVIWYSPSIFHGPLVSALKRFSGCKSYLILRDIFPEWAVDMGLMKRGPTFGFFKSVARYQYSVADVIGVQTAGNLAYFDEWKRRPGRTLEVLPNWLGAPGTKRCSIRVDETSLAGRKIFVYAGNMGIAQNMKVVVDVAERLRHRNDVGFLLIGRGSEVDRLKGDVRERGLENVLFFDEIDPDEIPDLYSQCNIGVVSLDPRHKSHNIPGKFLTYMQSGLPILAYVNAGNDLAAMVSDWDVGEASENGDIEAFAEQAQKLITADSWSSSASKRCKLFFTQEFSVEGSVRIIAKHFNACT